MHKHRAKLWLAILALGVCMAAASAAEEVSPSRSACSAATYPMQGLIETLQAADPPFAQQLTNELQAAKLPLTTPQAAPQVQAVLDRHALFAVSISPEARVKVDLGAADHKLIRSAWRTYLVRVQNDSLLTAPLVAESKHFASEAGAVKQTERWLSFQFVDDVDAGAQLAGRRIEYRVARVKTDELGKRAAVVAMNVGKGTQDLGFRNDVLALFTSVAPATEKALSVNLTGPDAVEQRSSGCTVTSVDEALEIDIPAGQPAQLEWTTPAIEGPVEARFRLKTNAPGDQGDYVIYWVVEGGASAQEFRRVPFIADGQWHDYRLPLADRGRVVGLRFSFPVTAHQASLANFVLATTAEAESVVAPENGLPESVEIGNEELTCRLDCHDHRYKIEDRTTGRVWISEPVSQWLRLEKVERRSDTELLVTMRDRFHGAHVSAMISLPTARDVRFAISTDQPAGSMDPCASFPPRFTTGMQAGRLIFCDRSCGVLLHQDDPTYGHWPLTVYANTHCLNMPWVGLYDEPRGDGVMLLVETPTDAEVALVADANGRHWPEVRWLPTMDTFGYERVASLRFTSAGGYVALAHRYRDYAKQIGRLKTLAEKSISKPQIERLRGAAVIWGARNPRDFITKLMAAGFNRGTVNQCRDPETVQWLTEQGFLSGRYDSYTDFLEGELAFQRDSVEKAAIHPRPGSAPKLGWKLGSGAQMHWRSSALWHAAQASYVPAELAALPYNSRFVDVAAASNLFEDYHPDHTFDRRQDLVYRRQAFETLNERGLVLGTEHGNDWVVDLVETHEGSMSGPFWWSSWPAGYVKRPTREQLSPNYLKFGIGYAHRIPLWELVYHDCIVSTWYWGDTAGILYSAAPELAERKDLLNLLYGTPPLVWANGADYRLPEEFPRLLRTLQETLPFHSLVAFEQLTNHEFLSADRAVQKTTFANGATSVVNFSDEPREYDSGSGAVTLAPRGYLVNGSGFSQSKLIVEGAVEAVTSTEGRLIVECAAARMINGIKSAGRVAAFRSDDDRWHVLCKAGQTCELDLAQVTGWEIGAAEYRVYSLTSAGEQVAELAKPDNRGMVTLPSEGETTLFAIVRTPAPKVARQPE